MTAPSDEEKQRLLEVLSRSKDGRKRLVLQRKRPQEPRGVMRSASFEPEQSSPGSPVNEFFYNFMLESKNRGYSYLYLDSSTLLSFTRFLLDSGDIFTNVFTLKLNHEDVLACKHGDHDWVDVNHICAPMQMSASRALT